METLGVRGIKYISGFLKATLLQLEYKIQSLLKQETNINLLLIKEPKIIRWLLITFKSNINLLQMTDTLLLPKI